MHLLIEASKEKGNLKSKDKMIDLINQLKLSLRKNKEHLPRRYQFSLLLTLCLQYWVF